MNFRNLRAVALATVAAASLVVGLIAPVHQAHADVPLPADGIDLTAARTNAVPALDSAVGRGKMLAKNTPHIVDLGETANGGHSALVRISVFTAPRTLTISAADAPALHVIARHSSSATVLLPLVDGSITIVSSEKTHARVEALAIFSGDSGAPGSTVALPASVLRADSASGLATDDVNGIGATPVPVGLTGVGGVPATSVRAVHVTLTTTSPVATSITLDGQKMPLRKGLSTISTIVTPSADGDVTIATAGPTVQVKLAARGYVVEAGDHSATLNGPGAFWPSEGSLPVAVSVSDKKSAALPLDSPGDDDFVLALVSATPSSHLTTVEIGPKYAGRAKGTVIDASLGAQPQLVLIPAAAARVSLKRGSSTVTVTPLGSLLGQDPGVTGENSIAIDSPTATSLDVSENLTWEFTGTIATAGSVPVRVEVLRDGELFGAASIRRTASGVVWSYTAAVQESGHYTFEFVVVNRAGNRSSAQWDGDVTLPAADEVIVNSDTVILDDPDQAPVALSEDSVTFAHDPKLLPGDVLVSGVSPHAPEGLLRRVVAIDVVDGSFVVTTTSASLEDVFLQASFSETRPIDSSELADAVEEPSDTETTDVESEIELSPTPEEALDLEPLLGETTSVDVSGEATVVTDGATPAVAPSDVSVVTEEPSLDARAALPSPVSASRVAARGVTIDAGGFDLVSKITAEVSHPNFPGASGKVEVKATTQFDLAIELTFEASVGWTEPNGIVPSLPYASVDRFRTVVTTVAKSDAQVSLGVKFSIDKKWTTAGIRAVLPPQTFAIGPVPVIITDRLKSWGELSVKLGAEAKIDFLLTTRMEKQSGIDYRNGKFHVVDTFELTSTPPSFTGAGIKATVEAVAGPRFEIALKIYDLVGPAVEFGAGLGARLVAETLGTGRTELKAAVFLRLDGILKFKFSVPIIDHPLLEFKAPALTLDAPIWEHTFDYLSLFSGEEDEYSPDDPDGSPDLSQPGDPSDGLGEVPPSYVGHTFVDTDEEFFTALATNAVTSITLGSSVYLFDDELVVPRDLAINLAGFSIRALQGASVSNGATLTIADTGPFGMFIAEAPEGTDRAGLRTADGHLVVKSGNVYGFGSQGGAGIGGDLGEDGGYVTVRGGKVYADAGENGSGGSDGGAGIGGGLYGNGGTLVVTGGEVRATGGDSAAGVGGGAFGNGGSTTVEGGLLYAQGDVQLVEGTPGGGAGIGGGAFGNGGTTRISAGIIAGSTNAGGAGIGGGRSGYGVSTTVDGGTIVGQAGYVGVGSTTGGAGIGGGQYGGGGVTTINAGTVRAWGQFGGAGIGGGTNGTGGKILISGAKVSAYSNADYSTDSRDGGAGIGGGAFAQSGSISILDSEIVAYGAEGGAGIGGGTSGRATFISIEGGSLEVYSDTGGAGIGGGDSAPAQFIRVSNASGEAHGIGGGAGVGGGRRGLALDVLVSAPNFTPYGYEGGASVGNGAF